jgi:hypothetical protein
MTYAWPNSSDTCSTPPPSQTKNLDQTEIDPSETKKSNEIKDLYSVVELRSEEHIVVKGSSSEPLLYSVVNHNDLLASFMAFIDSDY